MNKVIEFFKKENIYDEKFFEYIKDKVHYLPSGSSLEWFRCVPIVNDNILVDIRILVPEIITKENLLVNLHEFFHAYELYNELGKEYIENIEEKEINAKNFERKYLKSELN